MTEAESTQRSRSDLGSMAALDLGIASCGIHPTAVVDQGAVIGAGTKIWHFSHVRSGAQIGRRCTLGQNVYVASSAIVGDEVKIQNNVSIYDGVVLERGVFCGPSVVFTNVRLPRARIEKKDQYEETVVRVGATLGANSTILTGLCIGRYAFVAAGAVVTADVLDHAFMVGVPARRRGWCCRCGEVLTSWDRRFRGRISMLRSACQVCGSHYQISKEDGSKAVFFQALSR